MAREAKGVVVDEVEYIPIIENNREDPDPFGVAMLPMTAAEVNELERDVGEMTSGRMNFTERAQKAVRKLFERRVPRVWNYAIPHRKTRDMIRPQTGIALYLAINEHGDEKESTILDDIVKALKDHSHLREGLRETLSSQSAAQVSAMTSGAGAAGSAGAKN